MRKFIFNNNCGVHQKQVSVYRCTRNNDCRMFFKSIGYLFWFTPKECRKLAYRFAKVNRIEISKSWYDKQQAGPDRLTSFLKRHCQLPLCTPEITSLARASSFNKNHINSFFQNVKLVLNRYNFQPLDI